MNEKNKVEETEELTDQQLEEEFDKAFDNAETGTDQDEADPELDEDDSDADDENKDDEKDEADPDETDSDDSESSVDEDENSGTYKQRWKTLQGIKKRKESEWEEREQELLQQIEEAKTKKGAVDPDDSNADDKKSETRKALEDSLTDEQKEVLAEYDKEFETISKMEGLKRDNALKKFRAEMQEFVTGLFEEQAESFVPIIERSESIEERQHFTDIASVHEDFEQYRDDGSLLEWIESKPSYIRSALTEVYSNGDTDDVIDLITDFKHENNLIKEADDDGSETDDELETKRAQKKKALRSVKTRRGAVNVNKVDADDYENAFEEASNISDR